MKIYSIILLMFFTIPLYGQSVETKDGLLVVFFGNETYTVTPVCCDVSATVEPMRFFEQEFGNALQFTIRGNSNSTVFLSLTLPDSFEATGCLKDRFPCSFGSASLLWKETNKRFNPGNEISIRLPSSGIASFALGISADVFDAVGPANFLSYVRIDVKNALRRVVASASAKYETYIAPIGCLSSPYCEGFVLDGMVRGNTYKITPMVNKTILTPMVSGKERIESSLFGLEGDCNSKVMVTLKLPKVLINEETGDTINCVFPRDAGFHVQTQKRFDPASPNLFTLETRGKFDMGLGMELMIPESVATGKYTAAILMDAYYVGLSKTEREVKTNCNVMDISVTVIDYVKPFNFALLQNYPNPFNASTVIKYSLPEPSEISITVTDVVGRIIDVPYQGFQSGGDHQIQWNSAGKPSGVYYYRLQTPMFSQTKKLIIMQ